MVRVLAPVVAVLAIAPWAAADVVAIGASKDNTLYEDAGGLLSNGLGPTFFAGRTSTGEIRRGLLAFDIAAAVPAGSTITGVRLNLHMSGNQVTAVDFGLHRVLAAWGEGTSNAGSPGGSGASSTLGDATWVHTFFNTSFWSTPGGDFVGAASATASIAGVGAYSWSSVEMASEVQAWLDTPAANYGWAVVGGEQTASSAKRFDSRQSTTAAFRPVLEVTYTPVPAPGTALLAAGPFLFGAQRRRGPRLPF